MDGIEAIEEEVRMDLSLDALQLGFANQGLLAQATLAPLGFGSRSEQESSRGEDRQIDLILPDARK